MADTVDPICRKARSVPKYGAEEVDGAAVAVRNRVVPVSRAYEYLIRRSVVLSPAFEELVQVRTCHIGVICAPADMDCPPLERDHGIPPASRACCGGGVRAAVQGAARHRDRRSGSCRLL